jgi:hypothetical protein
MKALRVAAVLMVSGALGASCTKNPSSQSTDDTPQMHKDVAPHGGTPVPLGDDYNLELVHEAGSRILTAYVLDDEMEEFVRSTSRSITIVVTVGGQSRTLVLDGVANLATGESLGDTSEFEAKADWLTAAPRFDGNLVSLTVRGTAFTNVKFSFPINHEK